MPDAHPSLGDIAYYAPWGNLALFYREPGYADRLIVLGKFDGGVEALGVLGTLKVTIELMGNGDPTETKADSVARVLAVLLARLAERTARTGTRLLQPTVMALYSGSPMRKELTENR